MSSNSRVLGEVVQVEEPILVVSDEELNNNNNNAREINSFDESPPGQSTDSNLIEGDETVEGLEAVNENSRLLSNSPKIRARLSAGSRSYGSEDPASFHRVVRVADGVEGEDEDLGRKPFILNLNILFTYLFFYISMFLTGLIFFSLNSTLISNKLLFQHFASTFLPLVLSFASFVLNGLNLIQLKNSDTISISLINYLNLISVLFNFITMILLLSINNLRHDENLLTLLVLTFTIISTLNTIASLYLIKKYSRYLIGVPKTIIARSELGFKASLIRVIHSTGSFLSTSLPISIVNILLTFGFGLILLNVIFRAYDASLDLDEGQLWKVNPWSSSSTSSVSSPIETNGFFTERGRKFNLHLTCKGIEPLTSTSFFNETSLPKVRKTILIETKQGLPGVIGSDWLNNMLKNGDLTSPEVEVRVCYYDRPGYGFSQNIPSAEIPHLVSALSKALQQAGEFARLEPNSIATTSNKLNLYHTPASGFILIGDEYGSLLTSLFAIKHSSYINSILYLNPLPPVLHYSPSSSTSSSFTKTIGRKFNFALNTYLYKSIILPELAISRLFLLFSRREVNNRFTRRYSSSLSKYPVRSSIRRSYLQESLIANNPSSLSAITWNEKLNHYPRRETIVLTSITGLDKTKGRTKNGYEEEELREGTNRFIVEQIGRGLRRWNQDWDENLDDGERQRSEAVKELVFDC